MQRREFVRLMVAMGLAPELLLAQQTPNPAPPPPAPVPWMLGLNSKTPLPETEAVDAVAEGDLTFFSTGQMATLSRLSDLLVPALGDKPGALQAEAPVFLDFLIGISPDVRKGLYTGGLDWLDSESKKKYGIPFARTEPLQADSLVKPWLRTWMTDHPPAEPHAGFLNIAHADIRTATMNSEVWNKVATRDEKDVQAAGLFWSPIDPDVYAEDFSRVHVRPSPVVDAPRSSHTTPSYPQ